MKANKKITENQGKCSQEDCWRAVVQNDPNATIICDNARLNFQNNIDNVGNVTREGLFLPGTFGGGPLPNSRYNIPPALIVEQIKNQNIKDITKGKR